MQLSLSSFIVNSFFLNDAVMLLLQLAAFCCLAEQMLLSNSGQFEHILTLQLHRQRLFFAFTRPTDLLLSTSVGLLLSTSAAQQLPVACKVCTMYVMNTTSTFMEWQGRA